MKTKKKIAIIGAGIFGCTLAIILSRNFNVTIFEKNKNWDLRFGRDGVWGPMGPMGPMGGGATNNSKMEWGKQINQKWGGTNK